MEKTERKQSERIQTSLLNPGEKVVLGAIVRKLPSWVTSDQLTGLGVVGALMIAIGYALTYLRPEWLWLANLGFFLNWFGD